MMDLTDYIMELGTSLVENGEAIYVRAKVDGKWESVPLSECPAHVVVGYALQWMATGHTPVRVKDELAEEVKGA